MCVSAMNVGMQLVLLILSFSLVEPNNIAEMVASDGRLRFVPTN